jgi:peroxiredoxin
MSNTNPSQLEIGQLTPAFTLPGPDGMPHSLWDYKQREHLLLLFTRKSTTSETRGLLRAFARQYANFREEDCSILAISPDTVIVNLATQEELHLPFALLADPQREVIRHYVEYPEDGRQTETSHDSPLVSIVLADRYGALYQQWIAEKEVDLPPIEELLESIRYLNKLCTP